VTDRTKQKTTMMMTAGQRALLIGYLLLGGAMVVAMEVSLDNEPDNGEKVCTVRVNAFVEYNNNSQQHKMLRPFAPSFFAETASTPPHKDLSFCFAPIPVLSLWNK
jgi:hypothetical protein